MKKLGLLLLAVAGLGLAGCQKQSQTPTSAPIVQETGTKTLHKYVKVPLQKAWTTFLEAHPKAVVTGIDLEQAESGYHYKVDGVDDTHDYELTINAKTGKVSGKHRELLDAKDADGAKKESDGFSRSGLQSLTAVTELAENQIGNGDAFEWKLEKDDGSTVWNVSVKADKKVTVVTIDAYGGEILKTKVAD
ncbi:PepSY domain-containing protein [Lacticaseibacillus parakribbianus]|uniref:PepSY domain-containing protein n=1 Tax=Lacticaseibacillus parakribbianus TaxID=2970927 RepID=UPI0021CB3DF2|nr:PepSY domain-containing protein [Lacticaseibacillus parakribbianus]